MNINDVNNHNNFHPGISNIQASYFAEDQPLSYNTAKFDQYLGRKDYETIIKDPDLFFLAYCHALFPNQDKKERYAFKVSIEGQNVTVSGKECILPKVQKKVEEIRQFFVEGIERKKSVEFLVARNCMKVFLRKESPVIDISGEDLHEFYYNPFVGSALPKLAELCGASYILDKKEQSAVVIRGLGVWDIEVEVIKIKWKEDVHLVYPIDPKVILEKEQFREDLYSLYQEQELCDFSLICKDGEVKFHSNLLFVSGGLAFQRLLKAKMKETQDKVISLTEYSQGTIRAFMDFVYLGGGAFSKKVISSDSQETTNLFELFRFANVYQIESLIDCCTNLISLVATKKDLRIVQHLATLYNNEHLKLLYTHLLTKDIALAFKV